MKDEMKRKQWEHAKNLIDKLPTDAIEEIMVQIDDSYEATTDITIIVEVKK